MAFNREWYKNNSLKHRETGARWEKQNRDKVLRHERKYRDNHPDYAAKKNSTRRARLCGSFTQTELEQVKLAQWFGNLCCYYCGCNIDDIYHIEHVIPISRGGSNTIDNIVLACPSCNHSKGNKLVVEWRE